ncbi:unnamed protein product [Closterium sp. NIES-54]
MTLRASTAPLRIPLPSPPTSSHPDGLDPESDSLRTASPAVTRFLATAVTDPLFESTAASALAAELVDFATACRLEYATSLVAESASASVCPPSVRGECALGTDVLEDKQEEFECFAAAVPHFVSMLLALEGDPDAPDIPTLRSYAETIEGSYVDETPPRGANILSGMWIFRVKRPPGSPSVFKARYVARGFNDLVFATANTKALAHVKSELQKRHTCTDLAPPSDESVEPSGPYQELVGCLMYLMTCTRPDLAYPFSLLARYVALGRHRKSTRSSSVLSSSCEAEIYLLTYLGEAPRSPPVLYIVNKALLALSQERRLEHKTKHIALRYFLAQELQQRGQLRLVYVASQANTADVFTKALPPCDHQRFCTVLGLVPTVPHLLTS